MSLTILSGYVKIVPDLQTDSSILLQHRQMTQRYNTENDSRANS